MLTPKTERSNLELNLGRGEERGEDKRRAGAETWKRGADHKLGGRPKGLKMLEHEVHRLRAAVELRQAQNAGHH